MNKYTKKWTLNRSRIHFAFRVVGKWFTAKSSLLTAGGVHYIDSSSGGGKTLLMNYILRNLLVKGGFFWTNIDEFNHPRVLTFDINRLFKDGEMKFRLNRTAEFTNSKGDPIVHYCKGVIYDELNGFFNRRNNRQSDYNSRFVPLVKNTVIHRHLGLPRIYFIGQSLMLQDTQIQQILKYRHYVQAKFRWRYYFWRQELRLVFAPYKLKIDHFKKMGIDEQGNAIFKKLKSEKIKIDPI